LLFKIGYGQSSIEISKIYTFHILPVKCRPNHVNTVLPRNRVQTILRRQYTDNYIRNVNDHSQKISQAIGICSTVKRPVYNTFGFVSIKTDGVFRCITVLNIDHRTNSSCRGCKQCHVVGHKPGFQRKLLPMQLAARAFSKRVSRPPR
jgi:hypothetical protein